MKYQFMHTKIPVIGTENNSFGENIEKFEFGRAPSLSISWKSLRSIGVSSS
jgi:hypothetical protein